MLFRPCVYAVIYLAVQYFTWSIDQMAMGRSPRARGLFAPRPCLGTGARVCRVPVGWCAGAGSQLQCAGARSTGGPPLRDNPAGLHLSSICGGVVLGARASRPRAAAMWRFVRCSPSLLHLSHNVVDAIGLTAAGHALV